MLKFRKKIFFVELFLFLTFAAFLFPLMKKNVKDFIHCSHEEQVTGLVNEVNKVRGALEKVVSKEIAEEILKGDIRLGGEERNVTMLFADIRNFTRLTEKMDPKEVGELVNECMSKITSIIDRFHGVVDKYVGDEVMALFGIPTSNEEAPLNAVLAAFEIQKMLANYNEERKKQGKAEIFMGIGIHMGNVYAGNIGAENRLNYTVIGANVNLAAHLCSIARPNQVLITENVFYSPGVKEKIEVQKLNPKNLKGFTNPIEVFQVDLIKFYFKD